MIMTLNKPDKIVGIAIIVEYLDDEGQTQSLYKKALTFESAEENLGKLERYINKLV